MAITPEDFIAKWRGVELPEISASQSHFNELCDLLEIGKPIDVDPTGKSFTFEKAVPKGGKAGGGGHADVWRKDCFVWEYKRKNTYNTLAAAIAQARDYAALLDNPPLVVACDIDEIQIRTLFTGSVSVTHTIRLLDLNDVGKRQLLRQCFLEPQKLRPEVTPQHVTEEAARKFATLAQNLRERRDGHNRLHDARRVAHFLNKVVFCLFAEDAGLLPGNVFSAIVEQALRDKSSLSHLLADLFDKMRTGEGYFGTVKIPWFNGGLFDDADVLDLLFSEVQTLGEAMKLDWASIEPVIFGTLFERGLDPARRKEMAGMFDAAGSKVTKSRKRKADTVPPLALPLRGGATAAQRSLGKGVGIHYTDAATIMKIVEPVALRPLAEEWEAVKAAVTKAKGTKKKDLIYLAYRERLGAFRVLDPACGSGNFLYLALRHLKDFDRKVEEEAKILGLTADPKGQRITPKTVLGIEINPYAAELARVTVWIGELQWQMANGYGVNRRPILGALDGIENRDALLNEGGKETKWPKADVIIGNPPFLGDKKMIGELGEKYTATLRQCFEGRVPGGADLVTYWFDKARAEIAAGRLQAAGLVATNSVRGGANRAVMDRLASETVIFDAWSDLDWVLNSAAVNVSLVCFGSKSKFSSVAKALDGVAVDAIRSQLKATTVDLSLLVELKENDGVASNGVTKKGSFDVDGNVARRWLTLQGNPNGKPNSDVLFPWINGLDVTRGLQDKWIIHFGERTESEASGYEAPFKWVEAKVKAERSDSRATAEKRDWWLLARRAPALLTAISSVSRFLVTPEVAKHRVFVWFERGFVPDKNVVAIARDDDCTFGILHSCFHSVWALRTGTSLEDRPRYTSTTTFRTFAFPKGLTPNVAATAYGGDPRAQRIASCAAKLESMRSEWLAPATLVKREPEVVPGYPDRIFPKSFDAVPQLSKRTITNLYNERPTWLAHAHRDLDRAVAAAYDWPEKLADRAQPENADTTDRAAAEEEIFKRLFELNQKRSRAGH